MCNIPWSTPLCRTHGVHDQCFGDEKSVVVVCVIMHCNYVTKRLYKTLPHIIASVTASKMVDLQRLLRKLAEAEQANKRLEQENKRLQEKMAEAESEKKLLQEKLAETQRAKNRVTKEWIAAMQDAQNLDDQLTEVLAGN